MANYKRDYLTTEYSLYFCKLNRAKRLISNIAVYVSIFRYKSIESEKIKNVKNTKLQGELQTKIRLVSSTCIHGDQEQTDH